MCKQRIRFAVWTLVLMTMSVAVLSCSSGMTQNRFQDTFPIDKARLAGEGSNGYMILKPGYQLVLADGTDTLTITVLDETKTVDGVVTRVVEERETKGGRLDEVSRNYFAIDKTTGDIYYFGEDVDMYDAGGNVTGHEGSWLAGVNDAKFGLMMPGKLLAGRRFYQELAPKKAMDRAEVVDLDETVKVPMGTFNHCLRTRESSGLERGTEDKLYAPGVGLLRDEDFNLTSIQLPIGTSGLPDPVAKTFSARFPRALIEKLEMEAENGAGVYDFEFREGSVEKETDITAEGTLLESTIVVAAEDVPAAAMETVRKAVAGAALKRIEHIEISYELRNGSPMRLAKPVIHYAVEITKDGRTTEIVVAPDGTVIEPADI